MKNIKKTLLQLLPGLLLAVIIAVPSIIANSFCKPLSAVAIAILMGLTVRNLLGLPSVCRPGNKFIVKRVLKFAIILLGVRLSFVDVVEIGGSSILIILCCIVTSLLLAQYLTHLLKLPKRLGTLIGVGTCICGNSAIVATAPAIDAEEEEVAFAVATISLFGVLAILLYPILGHVLSMTNSVFGTWAGTAINDTSQVVTAGYIFSDEAGNIATVVKLIRNLFIAPVIVLMSYLYARQKNKNTGSAKKISYKKTVPLFVFGFVLMAALRSFGVFPDPVVVVIKKTAGYLIVLSIAAVGLGTHFSAMRKIGLRPFYVGLAVSIFMASLSLGLIKLIGNH